jgi:GTP-sensing pleiotropic transcriptional regulator CodY
MFDFLRATLNPKTGAIMTTVVDLCIESCDQNEETQSRGAVVVQIGGTTLSRSEVSLSRDHL